MTDTVEFTPEQIWFALNNWAILHVGSKEADELLGMVALAVEAEREECAKLVEERPIGRSVGAHHVFAELCQIAAAIRARTATQQRD